MREVRRAVDADTAGTRRQTQVKDGRRRAIGGRARRPATDAEDVLLVGDVAILEVPDPELEAGRMAKVGAHSATVTEGGELQPFLRAVVIRLHEGNMAVAPLPA